MMNINISKSTPLIMVASFLMLFCNASFSTPHKPIQPSLYERLGGIYAIATVVDNFVERLLVNDTLNANPAISNAREHVPKAGLKYQVTTFVSEATGGPQHYAGRSMQAAHQQLNINDEQFQAMLVDFKVTLDSFNVPMQEQNELVNLINSTKDEIVTQ